MIRKTRLFLDRAVVSQTDDCILWPYGKGRGYGRINTGDRILNTHLLVCELAHGPKPSAKHEAAHRCGKGLCINPRHIRWATHKENMDDMVVHGTVPRNRILGVRNGFSRLTEEQAREIKASRGIVSQHTLAKAYNVSQPTIAAIHVGRNWGWL